MAYELLQRSKEGRYDVWKSLTVTRSMVPKGLWPVKSNELRAVGPVAELCDVVYEDYKDISWLRDEEDWARENVGLLRGHAAKLQELATIRSAAAKAYTSRLYAQDSPSSLMLNELIDAQSGSSKI